MFVIYWPLVIIITIILYTLVLFSIPFSEMHATVFLFALISFWSRLPGSGMPSPFYALYLTDFVDFFSLIVAVNVGGMQGAVFSAFCNISSRACGSFPEWMLVAKDTIAQFAVCLIIPFIHRATGSDIFLSMIIYSVLRALMFFPLRLIHYERSFPKFLIDLSLSGTAVLMINAFYARLFGNFFDSLLNYGVRFSWILFLFVTIVILSGQVYMFRHSKRQKSFFVIIRSLFRRISKPADKIQSDETIREMEHYEHSIKELQHYIKTHLEKGYSYDAIQSALSKAGWTDDQIQQANKIRIDSGK